MDLLGHKTKTVIHREQTLQKYAHLHRFILNLSLMVVTQIGLVNDYTKKRWLFRRAVSLENLILL